MGKAIYLEIGFIRSDFRLNPHLVSNILATTLFFQKKLGKTLFLEENTVKYSITVKLLVAFACILPQLCRYYQAIKKYRSEYFSFSEFAPRHLKEEWNF